MSSGAKLTDRFQVYPLIDEMGYLGEFDIVGDFSMCTW
jgi:hypothetical protein